jgi:hypothetical protein
MPAIRDQCMLREKTTTQRDQGILRSRLLPKETQPAFSAIGEINDWGERQLSPEAHRFPGKLCQIRRIERAQNKVLTWRSCFHSPLTYTSGAMFISCWDKSNT